jgi:hypothetical protein
MAPSVTCRRPSSSSCTWKDSSRLRMLPEVRAVSAGRVSQVSGVPSRASWGFSARRFSGADGQSTSSGGRRASRRLASTPGVGHSGRRQIQARESLRNPGRFSTPPGRQSA